MKARKGRSPGQEPRPLTDDELAVFRTAVQDATPLPDHGRVSHAPRPPSPFPQRSRHEDLPALPDALSDHILWPEEPGNEEGLPFLRNGLSRQILRRLRRGHWPIQAELDLHGLTSNEARLGLLEFLHYCERQELRCVRIIHGKGLSSRNSEPVLKRKVRNWLTQRDEILAFCQTRPEGGGGGALMVLLKSRKQ